MIFTLPKRLGNHTAKNEALLRFINETPVLVICQGTLAKNNQKDRIKQWLP